MKILLTGIDGYCGWPLALSISKNYPQCQIIGVDNLSRRKWVKDSNSDSAIKIQSMNKRLMVAKKLGFNNIKFIKGDLSIVEFTEKIFKKYDFDTIIHCASQPSAPYANSNLKKAIFTLKNNNISLLNILWSMKKFGKSNLKLINTSTTGVYGQPNFKIPEGFIKVKNEGSDLLPFTNLGGSWYHITKSNDLNNLHLANRMWGTKIIDLRTAIVFGISTAETDLHPDLNTRFDFDFNFGVVVNRFCAMSAINHNLTVYGRGEQKRPFISLVDFVKSITNLINYKQKKTFEVFNQTTELLSIKYLAKTIESNSKKLGLKAKVKFIQNPRVEKEMHNMKMENMNFMRILNSNPSTFKKESKTIINALIKNKSKILRYKNSLL